MPFLYKIDILTELKRRGFNTNFLRKEKLFAESTIQKFRHQKPVSWENLEMLCKLLDCQPNDIIEYVSEETEE